MLVFHYHRTTGDELDKLTSSDLKRIANLCRAHADLLYREDDKFLAEDYFQFAKILLTERYRRFAE